MTENAQLELDDFKVPEEPQKSEAQRQVIDMPLLSCAGKFIRLSWFDDLLYMQEEELMGRKSALILQLSSAGAQLDSLIDENKHEIDEVLLDLLEGRTEAAIE